MAANVFDDKKPQPGDLIEIFRPLYQHWAIYIGDGYVIHLAPPTEGAGGGAYSMMSVLCDKAVVKKEGLWEVVGNDKYRINNLLDDKYEPQSISTIVRDAQMLLGQEQPYCVFRGNCEHFVTELRYGKAESRQVRNAMILGVGAAVGLGILVLAGSLFTRGHQERRNSE